MNIKDTLSAFLQKAKSAGCERLVIAYSGGLDSHVLLAQLIEINAKNPPVDQLPISAIYINHNIQPASTDWGDHCQSICETFSISFEVINVQALASKGENQEQKAREHRYRALAAKLESNHWLITAQHQNDQAETLLLQLLRGSGVDGLAAMPAQRVLGRGQHHRPLLNISQQEIQEYALNNHLSWIEDPSNQDEQNRRNYLRARIIPALQSLWPETTKQLSRSASWMAETQQLMTDIAQTDLDLCLEGEEKINILELNKLKFSRQKNLLRYWFHQRGFNRPGEDKLNIIFEQVINSATDSNPELNWQGCLIRRYQQYLYLYRDLPKKQKSWQVEWDGLSSLTIAKHWGSISVAEELGKGLSLKYKGADLQVQSRKGGEICQPVERDHQRALKKLFHEYSVPPWYRDDWPLIYCDQQLVAVPGLFVCKGYEASPDEKGLVFSVDQTNVC